jgi:hypothetical protein
MHVNFDTRLLPNPVTYQTKTPARMERGNHKLSKTVATGLIHSDLIKFRSAK